MDRLVIPTIEANQTESEEERPDKMVFTGEMHTCGGDIYCAGRRVIENWCNALHEKKGYRGMDARCVMTMIKVQLDALNQLLDIEKGSRDRQKIRVEDVEVILEEIRRENRICIGNGEPELNRKEAFQLVGDLLLERLHVSKYLAKRFFGIMAEHSVSKSFKELDPTIVNKMKAAMAHSARLIFKEEEERV